jgi:hypothetical protein
MSVDSKSRSDVRKALAQLFQDNLVGEGQPLQAVYAYQKGDLGGETPVLLVMSSGSLRKKASLGASQWRNLFRFELNVFVEDASGAWTDADVEDRLDWIEKRIADVIADNPRSAFWDSLQLGDDYTQITPFQLGQVSYKMESLYVIAHVIES